MKNNILKKGLMVVIILLFIGSGLASGYNENVPSSRCNCQTTEDTNIDYVFDPEYPTMKPIRIEPVKPDSSIIDVTIVDTPAEFSWKNLDGKDWTTPARSQGQCGSCWLFGALGVLESVIEIKEECADLNPDLSEQYVLSCIPGAGSCNGGDPYNCAFSYIIDTSESENQRNGVVLEKCFNYQSNFDYTSPCSEKDDDWEEFLIPISDFWQSGFWDIDNPDLIDTIKSLIYTKGPVYSMYWASDYNRAWGTLRHKSTDYYKDLNEDCPRYVNHGIALVGWKDDPSIGNGGYWIVKNSWGSKWGYDGFFNLEYDCLNMGAFVAWVDYDPNSFDWPTNPHPPNSPSINGQPSGGIGIQHEYTVSSTDPDDDPIYYTIDWDDENIEEWLGPYASGEEITFEHSWARSGRYNIKVKAIDEWGSQSSWATISVSMPKNKGYIDSPILRFLTQILDFLTFANR